MFFIRLYIVLFFLLVIIFGLAILSGHEKITVKNIVVSGNAAVSADDVLAIANKDMQGRYWYLFARNNSLIFPRVQIKKDLLDKIKTIRDLDISWDNWQQISVNIIERKPHSVWCNANQNCYFADKDGYIYSQAPLFSGTMFIKDYGNIATSTDPIGQSFLPKEVYKQVFDLIDLLLVKNIKVISITFDGVDYRFALEKGPEIIFNAKNGFDKCFDNLFSAIETKNLDLEKDWLAIKYVDLRFDNKVVVGKK